MISQQINNTYILTTKSNTYTYNSRNIQEKLYTRPASQQSSSTTNLSKEKKQTTGLQKENVKNKHQISW